MRIKPELGGAQSIEKQSCTNYSASLTEQVTWGSKRCGSSTVNAEKDGGGRKLNFGKANEFSEGIVVRSSQTWCQIA